jgi:hypothetical protein
MKRDLNQDERDIVEKQLIRLQEEKEYNEAHVKHAILAIDSLLYVNYKKSVQEYKDKKKQFIADIENLDAHINMLKDQLKNGVEIIKKENKK